MSAAQVDTAVNVLAGALPPGLARPLVCRWPTDIPVEGVVVFCHGLGSNGGEYAAISRHWAAQGYLVIHPTFDDAIALVAAATPALGLDPAADLRDWVSLPTVRAHMHHILHAPANWLGRVRTVGATLDALPRILAETCGAADLPTAVAGHSFGAYTAQLLAGVEIDLPGDPGHSFRDARFRAALILSGQGRDQQGLRDGSWDQLTIPTLTVTGTLDRGANGGGVDWKSEPFTLAHAPDQYLAVIEDGDHFLGGFDGASPRHVPAQAEALRQITTHFLNATLKADPEAHDALRATPDRIGDCTLTFDYR